MPGVAPATRSLSLVPPASRTNAAPQRRHSALALWHLLSLDAPTVAAVWTYFIAHCCGIALPWSAIAAMFVAVWMLYGADRLLDARSSSSSADLEERHHFHHHHRVAFLWGIAVAGVLLAALLLHLPEASLRLYAVLGSLLIAYFLLIHLASTDGSSVRLPKELVVGLFFSAAVFIPTVARVPMLRRALIPYGLLFAAVCTLNCLYVYAWEHPGKRLTAHWTTRWATRHLSTISIAIVLCGFSLATYQALHVAVAPSATAAHVHPYLLGIACALAAAFFRLLHKFRSHFSKVHLRAAVDFVLLTPVLLLPWR